ncbi:hypothetical protein FA048_11875 [Pedobacter polaris]|uniref:Uncharacterized protein n=1 Tax=Pedobacter polaris TaxID=2571273 RepID=A0A4U1CWX5_9SPHI|nr:hypothetical protein [Pedobacter polaris]TKC10859.1 hypothetical protein FA048_11875 [Pedobacter polaris]
MGTSVYYGLLGTRGYINIEILGVKRLIYVEPNGIKPIDFTGLKPYQEDEVEIDVMLVEDLELHKSTDGKLGFKTATYRLQNLGSFERYEIR